MNHAENEIEKELMGRFDRKDIRLWTINKIPRYREWPSLLEETKAIELLTMNKEWGIRCEKKVGNFYFYVLDFDFQLSKFHFKIFPQKMKEKLQKNFSMWTKYDKLSFIKTNNGFHIYVLSEETIKKRTIFFSWYWKRWNIGSIRGKGQQAQAIGSQFKKLAGKGKWFLKVKNESELENVIGKFFFQTGKKIHWDNS
jgi:hypothetical protein